jgi:hypothetical protein
MLCWRRVEEGVDQLEYLGLAGRVGDRVVRESGAVGAAGGHQGEDVQVAGGLLVGGAEAAGAELDGGDPVGGAGQTAAAASPLASNSPPLPSCPNGRYPCSYSTARAPGTVRQPQGPRRGSSSPAGSGEASLAAGRSQARMCRQSRRASRSRVRVAVVEASTLTSTTRWADTWAPWLAVAVAVVGASVGMRFPLAGSGGWPSGRGALVGDAAGMGQADGGGALDGGGRLPLAEATGPGGL